ncbi:MAG: 6-carboxytetrahydropterin synthase [Gammaproteobacteria bacterium]|jgi:6-pyruvoyltetrahydropterin/6-carboxytetrahydropterin synthase|nr:6-carboxytetrahydropterin synthase [Zhongshania sp.]MBU0536830.1 6-carboxytetrahydropterin synthase [Gammaproteobacteria bacterium]MBU1832057.1 6-carboxytetrahydropterin synthase [Gammaproteobacteria bacterium]
MPVKAYTSIEICKEDLKFSGAHFTIFSATDRERLHGHNFKVSLLLTADVGDNGMCFSYVEIKSRLRKLCARLDEYTLLPAESPYMRVVERGNFYIAEFNGEEIPFLQSDTLVLPVRNTTVEEFARYLLELLLTDAPFIEGNEIRELVMKVSSGPGQWGSASWTRD